MSRECDTRESGDVVDGIVSSSHLTLEKISRLSGDSEEENRHQLKTAARLNRGGVFFLTRTGSFT